MFDPLTSAPRTVTVLTFGLLGLSAFVAVSYPALPPRQVATPTCSDGDATATCSDGPVWEKLICDDPIKLTKCFDAKLTCANWKVCDCCSPVPLHKCLSPLAGRDFGSDCSSPIDAREQCCGDATTHIRSFKGLQELKEKGQAALEDAKTAFDAATKEANKMAADVTAASKEMIDQAKAKAAELKEQYDGLVKLAQGGQQ